MRAGCLTMRMPARAIAWMFTALNTVEPPIFDHDLAKVLARDEPWHEQCCVFSRTASGNGWATFPVALAIPTGHMAHSAPVTF